MTAQCSGPCHMPQGSSVTADSIDRDSEAWELMMRLVMGHAENARLDSQELLDAGWEIVPVRGLPSVLWRPPTGPLGGALLTEARALREIRPVIGDEEGRG